MGGDKGSSFFDKVAGAFQLTPPMWVATILFFREALQKTISTHTTHVGGDLRSGLATSLAGIISTHTTHVGGDFFDKVASANDRIFQLTPPMWVATTHKLFAVIAVFISTHTTHVGGDIIFSSESIQVIGFQLTPPMWVATIENGVYVKEDMIFQLTPPMWVAT